MGFRVIEGGRGAAVAAEWCEAPREPGKDDVKREAARRLGASGYHIARIREMATGVGMPSHLKYLPIQLNFAAEALSQLVPIPSDFDADGYWPAT
jgi:hypothetical protein